MPEIVRFLTDDHDTITHLVTIDEEHLTVDELAQRLDKGDDYYVTFDEKKVFSITIVAEDGHLEPTVDDPTGVHSLWDLPHGEDPEEEEFEEMFDEMSRMGEYDEDQFGGPERSRDNNPEELL